MGASESSNTGVDSGGGSVDASSAGRSAFSIWSSTTWSRAVATVFNAGDAGGFCAPQLPQKFSSGAMLAPHSLQSAICLRFALQQVCRRPNLVKTQEAGIYLTI